MQMAIDNEILRVLSGSQLYGTSVPGSAPDRDEIGVCIETPEYVFGLNSVASLLVRDRDLAQNLADGFDKLWRKAMRSLQEINVDPRQA
jgi:hypothetical protein